MDSRQRLSISHFIQLCEQLSDLIKSGLSLYQSLQLLAAAPEQPFHAQVQVMCGQLEAGIPFLATLEDLLPRAVPLHFAHVQTLPDLSIFLEALAHYFREKQGYLAQIQRQLAYPVFLIFSVVGVAGLMLGWMLPLYGQFFRSMNLPLPQFLLWILGIQSWISHYLWVLVFGFGIGLAVLWPKIYHLGIQLFFPFQAADVLWLLAVFLEGGFSLMQSLSLIEFPTSHPLATSYTTFQTLCLETGQFGEAFADSFSISTLDRALLTHCQKSAQMGPWLFKISARLQAEAKRKQARFLMILQPALLIVIASFVGTCLYVTFSPVLSLVNSLN